MSKLTGVQWGMLVLLFVLGWGFAITAWTWIEARRETRRLDERRHQVDPDDPQP